MTTEVRRRTVTTTDGLSLAVWEAGAAERDTIVAVHGYPDDHTVWDGLVEQLADRYHVVTYDVRGAGESQAPDTRSGYRMAQLAADLGSVIDAVAPGGRVHLLAHDWGSIQSWSAVTDPAYADRLASYTSISGPHLDMAGAWLRDLRHEPLKKLKQLASSYYILAFHLPFLPEQLVDRGVLDRLVVSSKRRGLAGRVSAEAPDHRDATNGLELYRANFLSSMARPHAPATTVPVQVLAPTDDPHVTVALAMEAPAPYCSDLSAHEIPGNHWVVSADPALVAGYITEFVDAHR